MSEPNLFETGIYTIPDAAELVSADARVVRIWVSGHKAKQEPIIQTQIGRMGNKVALSFTNLMELRFVATFAAAGVKLPEIRKIMSEAKRSLSHPHPFATKTVFKTDGRKIVAEIARANGIENIYDLKSKNYEMYPVVAAYLKGDVMYDPEGDAVSWRPRPDFAPNVILHPNISFGQPVLKSSRVPTETLADAVRAEGNIRVVARLFQLPESHVREAVKFEDQLRMAA